MSMLDRWSKKLDELKETGFYPHIKKGDQIVSKTILNRDIDENAWYYDKEKVARGKFFNIKGDQRLGGFEQDQGNIIKGYFTLLRNYPTFDLLVASAYYGILAAAVLVVMLFF